MGRRVLPYLMINKCKMFIAIDSGVLFVISPTSVLPVNSAKLSLLES